jgi:ParB family transcriptional regulator, chromosome partitioning protein
MSTDPKKRSRLGRGLSSLMGLGNDQGESAGTISAPTPVAGEPVMRSVPEEGHPATPDRAPRGTNESQPAGTPIELDIHQIAPNPHQPRRTFDDVALAELAASIVQNGLVQPIVVRATPSGYQLIAGERRLRAAKLAGLTTLPAVVRSADELMQAQLALVENIQRQDLNPIDRALGYQTLVRELGVSQAELAVRLGEERSTISNHLRLLDLHADVQTLVREGRLSLGHAKVLAGVADVAEQLRLARLCVNQNLSVRNLEKILAGPTPTASDESTPDADANPSQSAHMRDLELSMSRTLGLRVNVNAGHNKSKGRVVIHYTNLDEFDTLLTKLGVRLDD